MPNKKHGFWQDSWWALLNALAAYFMFFRYSSLPYNNDWYYFNALSLTVRSLVLHFGQFPIHNPWVCGGLDLMANPQTRIFSPFFLADLLLPPQWANLFSLFVYSVLGFLSMSALVRYLGCHKHIALVAASLFINGSWFGLHYAEGHIPYGSIQLLPLVVYLAMTIDSPKHVLFLALLCAEFFLDGGQYAVMYSLFLLFTLLAMGKVPIQKMQKYVPFWFILSVCVAAFLLLIPKIYPVVVALSDRKPWLDFYTMPWSLIRKSLFDPFQYASAPLPPGTRWRFHEFGCYFSWLGLALCLVASFRSTKFRKKGWPYIFAAFFWFWVGSGLIPEINPWLLQQRIPLFNNLHLPSRVFILTYFFFTLLVAMALEHFRKQPRLLAVLSLLLVTEGVFVRNYPMAFEPRASEPLPWRFIENPILHKTIPLGWTPSHYYRGRVSAMCYETSFRSTEIRYFGGSGYRGEVYARDPLTGVAYLKTRGPGKIVLSYSLYVPSSIMVNTNALYGWTSEDDVEIRGWGNSLLEVIPKNREGSVTLIYRPLWVPWGLTCFVLGLIFMFLLYLKLKRFSSRA